jgi:hypothetical protein
MHCSFKLVVHRMAYCKTLHKAFKKSHDVFVLLSCWLEGSKNVFFFSLAKQTIGVVSKHVVLAPICDVLGPLSTLDVLLVY